MHLPLGDSESLVWSRIIFSLTDLVHPLGMQGRSVLVLHPNLLRVASGFLGRESDSFLPQPEEARRIGGLVSANILIVDEIRLACSCPSVGNAERIGAFQREVRRPGRPR